MRIDGHTRLCGLIGNPVEHTLSPLIHNTLAQKFGHNLVYVPFHVKEGYLTDAVKGAYGLNVLGLNVTVPYKKDVIPCLLEIDGLAGQIGAVNTLVRLEDKDGYKGYNTDILGLHRALCSENIQLKGESVVLLGAGGAARAAAFLCAREGARTWLLNRSVDKAKALAEEVNGVFQKECLIPMALSDYEKLPNQKMTAIQSTSIGMYPDVDRALVEDRAFYQNIHTAYDLIFNPEETKFIRYVKEAGGKAFNGLKMLLYQGIIAYELWNQVEIQEETAEEVYQLLQESGKKR